MSITLPVPATPRVDFPAAVDGSAPDGATAPAGAADSLAVSLFADVLRAIGRVSEATEGPAFATGREAQPQDGGVPGSVHEVDPVPGDAVESEAVATGLPPADASLPTGPAMTSTPLPAPMGMPGTPVSGAQGMAVPARTPDATIRRVVEEAAASAGTLRATAPSAIAGTLVPRDRSEAASRSAVAEGAAATAREPARTASVDGLIASGPLAIGQRRGGDEFAAPAPAVPQGGAVPAPDSRPAVQGDPHVLRLATGGTTATQWRSALQEALGDRLQLQLNRGSEHALIRLDPPSLGRIEIAIRHEAGALQVHLSASNGEVLRQLAHIGDGLRQELSHRQYSDVQVVVGESARDADGRQRQPQQQLREEMPGQALAEADEGLDASAFALAPEGIDRT